MEFADRILQCNDCGAEFVFTAGEQVFFQNKGYKNDPKRCRQCRAKASTKRPRLGQETRVTCSACGVETTVPFKPTQGRAVLCHACFVKSKRANAATAAPSPPSNESASPQDADGDVEGLS